MFDGIEVRGVGWQEQQLATRSLDQLLGRWGLMKPGVIQHDHAARWQFGQEHLFKINIHHFRVATALKHEGSYQLILPGGGNDAGAFPAFARHGFVNPLASGRTAILTIQPVIHAALVEVKDGLAGELFQFPAEEPALHLVALAIFYEFFLA